ncbi:MAG: NAD(P)H-dependent oxidoreductase subunit E [Clostridiales bacterium]
MPNKSVRSFEKVCEIINKHNRNKNKLIPILQEIQEVYRYLPEEIMTMIATSLDISPAKIYGVATFYSHFTLKPKGKYVIKICDGTACHVKKSMTIHKAILKKLNLSNDKLTTDNMLFTLEAVSCLGACGLAPVVVINEVVYGQMTPEKTVKVLEEIIESEGLVNE